MVRATLYRFSFKFSPYQEQPPPLNRNFSTSELHHGIPLQYLSIIKKFDKHLNIYCPRETVAKKSSVAELNKLKCARNFVFK